MKISEKLLMLYQYKENYIMQLVMFRDIKFFSSALQMSNILERVQHKDTCSTNWPLFFTRNSKMQKYTAFY